MSVLQSDPGSSIPGALTPGGAAPGFPDSEQWGGFVTLDAGQVISGPKTFTAGTVMQIASGAGLVISSDGTETAIGATVFQPAAGSNPWFGIYDPNHSLYYGISKELPSPSGTSCFGGYFEGLGISGALAGHNAIFGVLSPAQAGFGTGSVAFTVYGDNTIETFHSQLDDGAGNMNVAGGLATAIRTITASATLAATDSVVLLNAATLTATLPSAAGVAGRAYTVKLTASGTTGTVATTSSQTIDGSTTYALSTQYKYVTVVSDGSDWFITASN